MSNRVFGIDLGTTYSSIAYIDEFGQPAIILNEDDESVTASTIFFESTENVIVGKVAKTSGQIDPTNYCELIKPHMGSEDYRREFHGKEYRPEELSAIILGKLKRFAEDKMGTPVNDVVITVPAYFDERQRNATEQAGKIAGFNVKGIIPEPTAAAIAYAATEDSQRTVLVYDLGGGTFDVTVMRVEEQEIRVICVKGDHNLGGRQWDDAVVNHLASEWQREHDELDDPISNLETLQDLLNGAEESKKQLTSRIKVPIKVSHSGKNCRVEFTREKFDELTEALLERTVSLTRSAADEAASLGAQTIDLILLVGGSSRMPQVKARLDREFPGVEQKLFDPELAVVKGAAIYANTTQIQDLYHDLVAKMFGKSNAVVDFAAQQKIDAEIASQHGVSTQTVRKAVQTRVVNVCSKSFGLVTTDPETEVKEVCYLIKRNKSVPATFTETFGTLCHNQTSVDLVVIESSAEESMEIGLPTDPEHPSNHKLKTITFHLPSGLPKGHPIEVTYTLSDDGGRLQVHAVDPTSGRSIEDTVENLSAIQPQEMEEMKQGLVRMKIQ